LSKVILDTQILGKAGDGQSIAPFGDEHDLASVGVGSEGEIGVAAPKGGLVNGHACERREVGAGEGEIDIARQIACTFEIYVVQRIKNESVEPFVPTIDLGISAI
jgi:hypothetical protein